MLDIEYTDEFEHEYRKLPLTIQKKAERQERFFRANPFYPSLHTEKLEPRKQQLWSFRVDRDYRVIFRFLTQRRVLLLTIGPHHKIYRYAG